MDRSRKPSSVVAMIAGWWFIADGLAPKIGAKLACDMGDEAAARVRRPIGSASSSMNDFCCEGVVAGVGSEVGSGGGSEACLPGGDCFCRFLGGILLR